METCPHNRGTGSHSYNQPPSPTPLFPSGPPALANAILALAEQGCSSSKLEAPMP